MADFPMDPRAYVWLPPRLARRIRRTLPLLGGVSTVVALAMAVGIPIAGYSLPTGGDVTTGMTVMLNEFCAVFLLISGVALLFAPTWVEAGHHPGGTGHILRLRPASMSVGPLCAGCCSMFVLPLFYLFYGAQVTWSEPSRHSDVQITFGIFVYMMLPLVAFVLGCVDAVVGWPLLRPSPKTLHRYSRL